MAPVASVASRRGVSGPRLSAAGTAIAAISAIDDNYGLVRHPGLAQKDDVATIATGTAVHSHTAGACAQTIGSQQMDARRLQDQIAAIAAVTM